MYSGSCRIQPQASWLLIKHFSHLSTVLQPVPSPVWDLTVSLPVTEDPAEFAVTQRMLSSFCLLGSNGYGKESENLYILHTDCANIYSTIFLCVSTIVNSITFYLKHSFKKLCYLINQNLKIQIKNYFDNNYSCPLFSCSLSQEGKGLWEFHRKTIFWKPHSLTVSQILGVKLPIMKAHLQYWLSTKK